MSLFRSIGFPKSGGPTAIPAGAAPSSKARSVTVPHAAPPTPKPMPKRAKGRWFISSVILTIAGFVVVTIWCEFVRYKAHGRIVGRVLQLSPIANGTITEIRVQEGEYVHQGQLLARLENFDWKRDRLRVESEMRVALSNLEVRLAEIRLRYRDAENDQAQREADYYTLLGDFHSRQARLAELKQIYETNDQLIAKNAVSDADLVASKAAYEGQQAQIEDLRKALEPLREVVGSLQRQEPVDLVHSEISRLRALEAEWRQLDGLAQAAEIRAPVSGRIAARLHFTGEFVRQSDVMFELIEAGSLSAVLYFTQSQMASVRVGDHIRVVLPPNRQTIPLVVDRIGERVTQPPDMLMRYYRAHQPLVPIYAIPACRLGADSTGESKSVLAAWIGAEVALPRFGWKVRSNPTSGSIAGTGSAGTAAARN